MNYRLDKNIIEFFLFEERPIHRLSQYAHRNQFRRSGEPYFFHPQEVGEIVDDYYDDDITYHVAMLHDALEDGIPLGNINDEDHFFDLLIDELDEADIESADQIFDAVKLLTKQSGQDYIDYVNLVVKNRYALRVKLADMMQNIGDNPSQKQVVKYANAKDYLVKAFNDKVPAGISNKHWQDFKQAIESAQESQKEN